MYFEYCSNSDYLMIHNSCDWFSRVKTEKASKKAIEKNGEQENSSSFSQKAAKSGVFVTISKMLRYGFTFITHLILLNLLNPADFGMMRYVTVVLGFINLINDAGFKLAVIQKKNLGNQEVFSTFLLSILFGTVFYLLVFFCAPLIALFTNDATVVPLLRVGGIAAFTGGASVIQRGLMQRQFRFARLSFIDVISAVAGSATGIIMALNGWGVWSLVYSIVIYNTLMFFQCTIFSRLPLRETFNVRSTFPVVAFGLKDIVVKILNYASVNIDYIIIGASFGEDVLGYYGFAFSAMLVVNTAFGIIFNDIGVALFSRLQGDSERSSSLFLKITEALVIVTVPYTIIITLSASDVIAVISFVKNTNQWVGAIPYMVHLAPVGLFYTFAGFPLMLWVAKGLNRLRVYWGVIALVTVVIAIFAGVPFGPVQVCTALLIRSIIMLPVSVYLNYRFGGVNPVLHLKTLVAPVSCGLISLVMVLVVHNITVYSHLNPGWMRLGIDTTLVFSTYLLTMWLFFRSIFADFEKLITLSGLGWINPFKKKFAGEIGSV
jgi:O-antigen/teichoic acid export membrane protein